MAILIVALYLLSSPPSFGWWDTGEYQTVAWIAGIAHPTGFPAATIVAWLFAHLLPFGDPAWRVTALSGVATGAAVFALLSSLRRFGVAESAYLVVGVLFSVGDAVWVHATRACVDSLLLLGGALATASGIRWVEEGDRGSLVRLGLFAGLTLSVHLVAIWYLPGWMLLALAGMRGRKGAWGSAGAALGTGLMGLALYAYLPIRSAMVTASRLDPTLSLGMPPGQAFWDYDHPGSLVGFVRVVTGADYGASGGLGAIFAFGSYPAFLGRLGELAVRQDGMAAALFAGLGLAMLFARRKPALAFALAAIAFGPIPFSMAYRMLDDAPKYYLLTLWILAWLAAVGVGELAARLPRRVAWIPATAIALSAVVIFRQEIGPRWAQREDRNAEAVVRSVVAHTESNAVIAGLWYFITPLAYARYVRGSLDERIPVANTPREAMAAWARTRPVYWFPETGVTIPNARLVPVPNTWPALYRVLPL